ncbi:hypothetical protein [Streptomyces sp. NPDC051684]
MTQPALNADEQLPALPPGDDLPPGYEPAPAHEPWSWADYFAGHPVIE